MKISIRHRRTYSLAVFCALTSVFLILHGCGGGGDGGGGGPIAVTYGISGQATLAGAGLSGVTMALSGVSSGNAITDASGNYTFTGLDNGSYTITPSKTGFTFSPTSSPQTVSGANITGVNFIATATPVVLAFSQADLTGTWDYINFGLGTSPGSRGFNHSVLTINGSGEVAGFSATFTISSAGVISVAGDTVRFQMSSNKLLIFGTDHGTFPQSPNVTGYWTDISVLRKRTGVVFSGSDLANTTFKYHTLKSGLDNTWEYGDGNVDAVGNVTITSNFTPSGSNVVPPNTALYSVSPVGIVTNSSDPYWYGVLTDDKKVIFSLDNNNPGYFSFGVIQITGQTYTQADYAGTWNFNTIRNTVPNPLWAYGVNSVDAAGNGTYLSYTDSGGNAPPANYVRVLSSTGVVTDPADATRHGQMSYNKDISVSTNTNAAGRHGLTIGFK